MRIGIIADTHDNLPRIQECVRILNEQKVELLLHCGDYIAPFALKPLSELACDWVGVFGNNDGEKKGLEGLSKGRIKEPPYFLEIDSKKIVVTHILPDNVENIPGYNADIILFGHTHKVRVTGNDILFINPGEAGGWLYQKPSLAVLDLKRLKPEIIYF